MRRQHWMAAVVLCAFACSAMAKEETKVHVRQAPVRNQHAALAKVVANLKFAEVVQELEQFGTAWIKISARAATVTGWLRKSAVTDKPLNISKDGSSGSASQTEMTLAGQAAREASAQYVSEKNLEDAMRKVKAIENDPATNVGIDRIVQFLRAGNIKPTEGN